MSTENPYIQFADLLKTRPELQEQLKTIKHDYHKFIKLYVHLAKENGYELSLPELKKWLDVIKSKKSNELSEHELEKIAAGNAPLIEIMPF